MALLFVLAVGPEHVGDGTSVADDDAGASDLFVVPTGVRYRLVTARRWQGESQQGSEGDVRSILAAGNLRAGCMAFWLFMPGLGDHGGSYTAVPNVCGAPVCLARAMYDTDEISRVGRQPFLARIAELSDNMDSDSDGARRAVIDLESVVMT